MLHQNLHETVNQCNDNDDDDDKPKLNKHEW